MNGKEFAGLGRTWWTVLITIGLSTTMFWFDKITADAWQETLTAALGAGTLKSTFVAAITAWKVKQPPAPPTT